MIMPGDDGQVLDPRDEFATGWWIDAAVKHHNAALALARRIHDKTQQVRALDELAQAASATGRTTLAASLRLRAGAIAPALRSH